MANIPIKETIKSEKKGPEIIAIGNKQNKILFILAKTKFSSISVFDIFKQ